MPHEKHNNPLPPSYDDLLQQVTQLEPVAPPTLSVNLPPSSNRSSLDVEALARAAESASALARPVSPSNPISRLSPILSRDGSLDELQEFWNDDEFEDLAVKSARLLPPSVRGLRSTSASDESGSPSAEMLKSAAPLPVEFGGGGECILISSLTGPTQPAPIGLLGEETTEPQSPPPPPPTEDNRDVLLPGSPVPIFCSSPLPQSPPPSSPLAKSFTEDRAEQERLQALQRIQRFAAMRMCEQQLGVGKGGEAAPAKKPAVVIRRSGKGLGGDRGLLPTRPTSLRREKAATISAVV
jgi:hypothetical protein